MLTNVLVHDAKHRHSQFRQLNIAIDIVHLAREIRYVTSPIELHRKFYLGAIEINDVATDRMLPTELELAEPTVT